MLNSRRKVPALAGLDMILAGYRRNGVRIFRECLAGYDRNAGLN